MADQTFDMDDTNMDPEYEACARRSKHGNRGKTDSGMAPVSVTGWTTYSPPEDDLAADRIKGALDAAVHDCRLFARLAREARLIDLPTRLRLSWEDFCQQRLRRAPDVVEALIAGLEFLGEELPVSEEVATRVGQKLRLHGRPRKDPNKGANGTLKRGNVRRYILARLTRDATNPHTAPGTAARCAQLLASVEAGDLSAHQAAIQARYRKPTIAVENTLSGFLKAARRHLTDDDRRALKAAL